MNNKYRMTKLKLSDFEIKTITNEIILEDGTKKIETVYITEGKKRFPKLMYEWNTDKKIFSTLSKTIKDKSSFDKLEDKEKELFIKCKNKFEDNNKIIVRDTELIRIIRALNLGNNSTEENGYTYIKDLICVAVSVPKYRQIEKDGLIEVNNVLYKRILASSGNVRNKKVIFIKEELFNNAMTILLCGLPEDMEHEQISKFNAYVGLVNSDTIPVSTPNIVVIDDFKKTINETFDLVIKDETGKFDVKLNQKKDFEFMPFDGAGLVDIARAETWAKELNTVLNQETGKNKVNFIPY